MTDETLNNDLTKLRFLDENGENYPDWEEKSLGEVANLKNGYAFKSSDYSTSGKYKVITIKNVSGSTYVDSNNVSYVKEKPKKLAPHQSLKINDILVSLTGNVGRISVVNEDNLLLNQRVGLIEINKDLVNNLFLSIILSFNRFENTMIKNSQGGAQKNISKGDIEMYEVNLPSLPEQTKIADFLSNLDERIEQQSKLVELLKKQKQGYMQRILGGGGQYRSLRFKNDDGTDYPDWEVKTLGEIAIIRTGKLDANAQKENGKYRFYTCAKKYSMIDNYAFDEEALMVSGNGAHVGYIHYYNGKFNAYQRTYVLSFKKDSTKFIQFFLEFNLKKRILKGKNEGNMPYIVLSVLSEMLINLPSLPEQEKIAEFLSSLDNRIDEQLKKLKQLKSEKNAYMQRVLV